MSLIVRNKYYIIKYIYTIGGIHMKKTKILLILLQILVIFHPFLQRLVYAYTLRTYRGGLQLFYEITFVSVFSILLLIWMNHLLREHLRSLFLIPFICINGALILLELIFHFKVHVFVWILFIFSVGLLIRDHMLIKQL